MEPVFYITTPIYYVNDEPHLGHAYTTILADVLARFARLRGRPTLFVTGVDEHGQKAQNAASRLGLDPEVYVDQISPVFQAAWRHLNISQDDYIRTTQPRHIQVVSTVLSDLWARGEIYRGEYAGWYCVPDERFWTEKDLAEGLCPDCGRPVERIVEPNYFFRMSRYQDWLTAYIQSHPDFIRPETRRSEILSFLRQPLGDLCISRPVSRLKWGIPLPFDHNFVTYVWFDALLNYVTAAGYLQGEPPRPEGFDQIWPQAVHLIGKDILTTHCVYWPIMLEAAGLPQPKGIFAHGWWIIGGEKMSKSRGNAIRPLDLAELFGVDAFRFFLVREMAPGADADFSAERLAQRYQADLANNLGNLLQRVCGLISKNCAGVLPAAVADTVLEQDLQARLRELPGLVFARVDALAVHQALELLVGALTAVNLYLDRTAPWKEARSANSARLDTILYTAAEAVRLVSVLFAPVMPERTAEIWKRLGWQPSRTADSLQWGGLQPGVRVVLGEPLFPRVENLQNLA
jgi:methionyl-tRNA synthetase